MPLSTGKLLSNIERCGPKAVMQVSTYGRQAFSRSCEEGGMSFSKKVKPVSFMPNPPTLT